MRAAISLVLDNGTVMEGEFELREQLKRSRSGPSTPLHEPTPLPDKSVSADFDLGVRPFMKKHSAGLSGPERLILLVAHLAKGTVQSPVARGDVVRQWGKMKPIMGGKYNGAYDTRARETGWVNSPKPGVFELRPGWENIFKQR